MHFLVGFLLINAVVAIHELGHLLVARWFGVTVSEFALGFGPVLWSTTIRGIRVSIRGIPLGGFVSIRRRATDSAPTDDAPATDPASTEPSPFSTIVENGEGALNMGCALEDIAPWKQVVIMLAGIGANACTAVIVGTLYLALAPLEALAEHRLSLLNLVSGYAAPAVDARAWSDALAMSAQVVAMTTFLLPFVIIGDILTFQIAMDTAAHGNIVPVLREAVSAHAGGWWMLDLVYTVSVAVASFNVIPLLPLDGGQVLKIAVLDRIHPQRIREACTGVYVVGGAIFILAIAAAAVIGDLIQIIQLFRS